MDTKKKTFDLNFLLCLFLVVRAKNHLKIDQIICLLFVRVGRANFQQFRIYVGAAHRQFLF